VVWPIDVPEASLGAKSLHSFGVAHLVGFESGRDIVARVQGREAVAAPGSVQGREIRFGAGVIELIQFGAGVILLLFFARGISVCQYFGLSLSDEFIKQSYLLFY